MIPPCRPLTRLRSAAPLRGARVSTFPRKMRQLSELEMFQERRSLLNARQASLAAMVSGGEYQDVLVDALRGALGRDRPPRLPPVPDDVKSVGVQTPANVQDPSELTGPTIPRGVCPACRRAPANWRACGECQRMCADGGSSGGDDDDDDDVRPSRTLARCLRRSKSRCVFRTWRRRVLSCAEERRDVEKATDTARAYLSHVARGAARGPRRGTRTRQGVHLSPPSDAPISWPRGAIAPGGSATPTALDPNTRRKSLTAR